MPKYKELLSSRGSPRALITHIFLANILTNTSEKNKNIVSP